MSLFYVEDQQFVLYYDLAACKYNTMEIKFGINDTEMSCISLLGAYKKIGWK